MNPQGGDRSNQGRRRTVHPSGFPAEFGHPFAGMGMPMMGMSMFGGGGSLFDDFFTRNPFDDPVFNRPFGSMFGSTGGLFGPGGFMGMGGLFENGSFFDRPQSGSFFLEQQQQQQQRQHHAPPIQSEGRRGPVIEELPDDHEEAPEEKSQSNQKPIIEHPDDDMGPGPVHQARGELRQNRSLQAPSNSRHETSSSFQSFSFQSSSVSYGGGGGSYYCSSSSRRVGSDGVREEEHFEKDSSGNENRMSARGIHDKVHAFTKKRQSSGPESTLETLHNLTPEEAPQFDTEWEARAQYSLPGRGRGRSMALEGNSSRVTRQVPQALQYNNDEGYSDGNQPPRKQLKISN